MAPNPGQVLLGLLRRQVVDLLGQARAAAAEQAGFASPAPPGDAWTGSGLEDRLAGVVIDPAAVAAPLAGAVLTALSTLGGAGADGQAQLLGWDPDPAAPLAPRGLAYALRTGGVALAVAATDDGRVTVAARAQAGFVDPAAPPTVPLGGGWALRASGSTTSVLEVVLGPDGPVELRAATPGDTLQIALTRSPQGPIGTPPGPALDLGAVKIEAGLGVDAAGVLAGSIAVSVRGGSVTLGGGALASLLPALAPIPIDVDLVVTPGVGVQLAGSTALATRLPISKRLGPVEVDGLDLLLRPGVGPTGAAVDVEVRAPVAVRLPGAPIRLGFDGLGLRLPFGLGDGAPGLPSAPEPVDPTGALAAIDLPIVRGTGFLSVRGPGEYVGGLSVSLPPLAASAFGILALPTPERPLSFLVVMGATFPPPGIQVGFGFAVTGIGGIVGVNRRVDREALTRAVADGSAARLLFPADPAASADAVRHALPAIFPEARGSTVVGPMFQLGWGGRAVTASVAVVTELSAQPRVTILGTLVVALPDPVAPLIFLQATFAGFVDPATPSTSFVASLAGSRLVGVALSGDVYVLVRGGSRPDFVISAGGFHPAFDPPRGTPELRRLAMDLSMSPFLQLRCEAYLAITPSSYQFGARLELVAEVADCGLRGFLQLDVLIRTEPHLSFVADLRAGIAIEVFGESLVGIALSLRLEGPTPWRAQGRGSIDLFFFDVSFDFDVRWGPGPPAAVGGPPRDLGEVLALALARPDAWTVRRSDVTRTLVRATPAAEARLAAGTLVDPYATFAVRQQAVPLGVPMQRYEGRPVPPQSWAIGTVRAGPEELAKGRALKAAFAPGQLFDLDDDAKLGRPAFEQMTCGFDLVPTGLEMPPAKDADIDFESKVVTADVSPPLVLQLLPAAALDLAAETADPAHDLWWQVPADRIEVDEAPPLAAAEEGVLVPATDAQGLGTVEMAQLMTEMDRTHLTMVEAWELR